MPRSSVRAGGRALRDRALRHVDRLGRKRSATTISCGSSTPTSTRKRRRTRSSPRSHFAKASTARLQADDVRSTSVARFMMMKATVDLRKLPVRDKKGNVYVVVETPRGSAAKLEFDPDLKLFTLSKALILGLAYPYDWGFIPSTKGEDGDPLDALVLHAPPPHPALSSNAKSSVC